MIAEQGIASTKNRLQVIQTVFDLFSTACLQYYSPNSHICIDKRLAAYCGYCPFRVHMKSKLRH